MKKLFSVLAFVCLFSIPASAADHSGFNLDAVKSQDIAANPDFTPAMPSVPGQKEWTVMFYSTTKDQLRYSLMWQLLEMKKTGSTDKVNVVIQAAVPVKGADGAISTPTIRMALGKAGNSDELDQAIDAMFNAGGAIDESVLASFAGDIVMRENNTDTGNWKNVAEFTKWAKTNYPAKRYAFAIYGHGNGIFDQKKETKGTLIDMETKNYVTLPEMRLLMAETGKVNLFIMTSCIMQMAEVAWQIKDYTDVVVGSSELMSSVGYDLKGMLDTLNAAPGISSEELGAELTEGYVARIKAFNVPGGHASVIVTSRFPGFVEKLNLWVDAELALKDSAAVSAAGKDVMRFDIFGITVSNPPALAQAFSISGDLYDFVSLITASMPADTPERLLARQKGLELMTYISDQLIYKYSYTGVSNTGFDYGRGHGLAIHIPPTRMIPDFEKYQETIYWDLPFARETKWGEFLGWMYNRR